jgi:TatD DNase family protein
MIDSHCHLADTQFDADLPDVLRRAKERGVRRMICIGDSIEESRKGLGLAQEHPEIFCTVGVHPHVAKEWKPGDEEVLKSMARSSDRVRAIGEIGLDYHYMLSPIETQRQVFASQLTVARQLGLPAVVHCREAVEDVWAIVREFEDLRIVIHCCIEQWHAAEQFVAAGHFLSFTGIATYKNAAAVRETILQCPIGQMMIETDSPYLAPVPHRGKRNEPAFVHEVAQLVAELKGMSVQEIDAITNENTVKFFHLPVQNP